jgi:hypothetical protein
MHRSWAKALMQRTYTSRQAAEHAREPTTNVCCCGLTRVRVSPQPRQQFMRFSQAPRRPHATTHTAWQNKDPFPCTKH